MTRWTLTLEERFTIAAAPDLTYAVVYKGRTVATYTSLPAAERAAQELRDECGLPGGSKAVVVLAQEGDSNADR